MFGYNKTLNESTIYAKIYNHIKNDDQVNSFLNNLVDKYAATELIDSSLRKKRYKKNKHLLETIKNRIIYSDSKEILIDIFEEFFLEEDKELKNLFSSIIGLSQKEREKRNRRFIRKNLVTHILRERFEPYPREIDKEIEINKKVLSQQLTYFIVENYYKPIQENQKKFNKQINQSSLNGQEVRIQNQLLDQALFQIADPSVSLYRFDTQGHVITEVNLKAEDKPTFCNLDIPYGHPLQEKFQQWLLFNNQNKKLDKAVTALIDSLHRNSIIPLQEEMEFHMRLSARVIRKYWPENINLDWQKIHDEAALIINGNVRDEFIQALVACYDENEDALDIKILNKELDKKRKSLAAISKQALIQALKEACEEKNKKFYFIYKEYIKNNIKKEDFSTTTATGQDYFATDAVNGTALRVKRTHLTAHNKKSGFAERILYRTKYNIESDEIQPLSLHHYESRIPSIDNVNAHKMDSIKTIKNTLRNSYQKIQKRSQGTYKGPIIYNLLTSLHSNLFDFIGDGRNRQRKSAGRILKGSHLFNLSQVSEGEIDSLCYVQNIPVNQHTNNLGYTASRLDKLYDSAIVEATLMSEIAMLHTISRCFPEDQELKKQYHQLHGLYLKFLVSKENDIGRVYFKDSQYGIAAKQALIKYKEENRKSFSFHRTNNLSQLAAEVLLKMMTHNKHWNKQYGMLIQSLSVFIEKASISGCKSANERYLAVSGRVQLLHAVNESSRDCQNYKFYKPLIKALMKTAASTKNLSNCIKQLQCELDTAYNHFELHGPVRAISGEDQGGPHKGKADPDPKNEGVISKPNTNYFETSRIGFLFQKNAKELQGHKKNHHKILNNLVKKSNSQKVK